MKKTIHEIFKSIEYNDSVFPKAELQELIDRKEESQPYLLKFME